MSSFICHRCKEVKLLDRASKRQREGRTSNDRCLDCEASAQKIKRDQRADQINKQRREAYPRHALKQKDTMLRKAYGISLDEWKAMLIEQRGSCAICFTKEPRGRGWQTDHDHKTGKFRAILCHNCNSLLGHAMESPEVLLGAFRYLCVHGGGADKFLSSHFEPST